MTVAACNKRTRFCFDSGFRARRAISMNRITVTHDAALPIPAPVMSPR
jgi:hypothetical protein